MQLVFYPALVMLQDLSCTKYFKLRISSKWTPGKIRNEKSSIARNQGNYLHRQLRSTCNARHHDEPHYWRHCSCVPPSPTSNARGLVAALDCPEGRRPSVHLPLGRTCCCDPWNLCRLPLRYVVAPRLTTRQMRRPSGTKEREEVKTCIMERMLHIEN